MTDLPTPAGWKRRYLLFGCTLAATAAAGVYFTGKAVRAAAHTHWVAAMITAAAALVSLIIAVAVVFVLVDRVRLRASYDATGTTLRPAPVATWLVVMFTAITVGSGLYLFFGAHVHEDLPTPHGRDEGRLITLLIGGVLGLGLMIRNSRRARPALILSAEGIDYTDASVRFTVAWNDIRDITGVLPKTKGRTKAFRPVVLERGDEAPAVINNAAAYVSGGAALYWMICHYWRHPDERGQLANGVAIDRLTGGGFAADERAQVHDRR